MGSIIMSKVLETNCETGETILRDMTADELAVTKRDQDAGKLDDAKEAERIAKVEQAQAKLAALGLTVDDLKALGL